MFYEIMTKLQARYKKILRIKSLEEKSIENISGKDNQ